jgi:hypothetical protein
VDVNDDHRIKEQIIRAGRSGPAPGLGDPALHGAIGPAADLMSGPPTGVQPTLALGHSRTSTEKDRRSSRGPIHPGRDCVEQPAIERSVGDHEPWPLVFIAPAVP